MWYGGICEIVVFIGEKGASSDDGSFFCFLKKKV